MYLSASSSVRQPIKPSSLQLTFLLRLAHLFVRHIVQREIFRRWRKLNHSLFYMHVGLEFFALWHCLAFKRWFKRTQVAIFNNVATCHKIACYLCRIAQNSRNFCRVNVVARATCAQKLSKSTRRRFVGCATCIICLPSDLRLVYAPPEHSSMIFLP